MAQVDTKVDGTVRVFDGDGEAVIHRLHTQVIRTDFIGKLTGGLVDNLLKAQTPMLDGGVTHLFTDASRLTTYDPAFRIRMTEWVKANQPRIVLSEVLVTSKMTAMGLSVANLVLGGRLKGTSSPAEFERSIQTALANLRSSKGASASR